MVVFFDVGGTLVEVSPSIGHVYSQACASRGAEVEPRALQHAFDRAWVALSDEVPRGADRYRLFPGGEREWWELVSSRAFDLCGVPIASRPPVDELRGVFARADAWRVYPEAREAIEALRRRGHRLGVISNWDSRLPRLLCALGLQDAFETVVYSAAAGVEKPHPEIFRQALDSMDVEAVRAVHIGDRFDEDYAGARAAGLRALLIGRGGRATPLREELERDGEPSDLVGDLLEAVGRILDAGAR